MNNMPLPPFVRYLKPLVTLVEDLCKLVFILGGKDGKAYIQQVEIVLEIMRMESPELYIHILQGMHTHVAYEIVSDCKSELENLGKWEKEVLTKIQYHVSYEEPKSWVMWCLAEYFEDADEDDLEDIENATHSMSPQEIVEYLNTLNINTGGKTSDVLKIKRDHEDDFIEEMIFQYSDYADEEYMDSESDDDSEEKIETQEQSQSIFDKEKKEIYMNEGRDIDYQNSTTEQTVALHVALKMGTPDELRKIIDDMPKKPKSTMTQR